MEEDKLKTLVTESRNPRSAALDTESTMGMLRIMNKEDRMVAEAVEKVLPQVAETVDEIVKRMKKGGRLFYIGAGTSGRIGYVDASECPPTFMTSPSQVQAIMAGGEEAFHQAKENAEDSEEEGMRDIEEATPDEKDVVIGITASGRTPYPIGALKKASEKGAYTVALACNPDSEISTYADCSIEVVVGPEVLTGSTRLKAATSHKMILNMISTSVMVQLGKVYENLMVDVHASNYKLRRRAESILKAITDISEEEAASLMANANYEVKTAIMMKKADLSYKEAKEVLKTYEGDLRKAEDSMLH
ncbi:N-acetylmuramic acid 6-phosphate etherase [Salimicrobium halophilum]|uniref:N-acetylmuramic acid 6-phosphate etherase n=1 Tax=Salimicrobium halophilum TaxID=86666 RepID=A0A1G8T1K9_9BACI|nr:N-acetylmuramic acid 6-phosphate etherase [Salimicrobium halophilum]SDJ35408.1 N-acetylmuramic acid 6-phosphate etherase [Salimicrobium halophilum]